MPRPRDAKTFDQICELRRDNYPPKHGVWSILLSDDHVSLHQPDGGYVTIPRREFNVIVDWYMRDQAPAKKRKTA